MPLTLDIYLALLRVFWSHKSRTNDIKVGAPQGREKTGGAGTKDAQG